ncbi:MAG TPA: DnaJ domain-containing protein, partial [Anaerolineales bacterium]|nr:DnaJ domain-containing protein [Anaerolineales bacterium]
MQPVPDLYACLGVERTATTEHIRQAYRQAARRFHPDVNPDPLAQEEFKLIAAAYEVLYDRQRRAEYDSRSTRSNPIFTSSVTSSRAKLLRLPEPQIVYILAEIAARPDAPVQSPPLNLCLVIDRSTSMQGARLDQVTSAAVQIVDSLDDQDIFSVVTFSDRAEVVLPA